MPPPVFFSERRIISFIVASSAIYLAMFPFGLPHVGFTLGLFLFIYHIKDRTYYKSSLWLFLIIAYSSLLIINGSDAKTTVNNMSSMMMFPIVIQLLSRYDIERILSVSRRFIKVSIICFTGETIIRYIWSTIIPLSSGFYKYKFHSIFFQDTNFLGLALLVVIFYIRFLEVFFSLNLKKMKICSIVLLFMSISRAAILAWFIGEFLIIGSNKHTFNKIIIRRIIALFVIGSVLGTTIYVTLQDDPSFRSKLFILDLIEKTHSEFKFNPLFGAGMGNSEQLLGIFPHNSLLLYYLETGILGVLFKLFFFLYIFIRSKWNAIIVFLPYFIATQSATGYATHYLYVSLGLITLLSTGHKYQTIHSSYQNIK